MWYIYRLKYYYFHDLLLSLLSVLLEDQIRHYIALVLELHEAFF